MAFPVDANAHDAVVGLPGLAHKGPHIAAPDLHQPRLYHLLPRLGGFRHELSTLSDGLCKRGRGIVDP